MIKETWVFPSDGSPPYQRGTKEEAYRNVSGVTFMPDLPDFVSPIDGKSYSGRAGLREHCKIHNVVPNAELKGLPTLTTHSDQRSLQERKADDKRRLAEVVRHVDREYRKYNHG